MKCSIQIGYQMQLTVGTTKTNKRVENGSRTSSTCLVMWWVNRNDIMTIEYYDTATDFDCA